MSNFFRVCVVPGCENNSKNQPRKIFVRVPSNPETKRRWLQALGLTYVTNQGKYCCCEDHFNLEEDASNWMFYKTIAAKLYLRPDVVPHLNLKGPKKESADSHYLTDSERKQKSENLRAFKRSKNVTTDEVQEADVDPPTVKRTLFDSGASYSSNSQPSSTFYVTAASSITLAREVFKCHQWVQVETKDFQCHKATNTESQTALSIQNISTICKSTMQPPMISTTSFSSCGSSSSEGTEYSWLSAASSSSKRAELEPAEEVHFRENRRESTVKPIEMQSRFYLGFPQNIYMLVKLITKWTNMIDLHVFLTLKRIRFNDAYIRLANDFGMSVANVSEIFRQSVPNMANVMESFISWSSEIQIDRNLPLPFRRLSRKRKFEAGRE